MASTETIPVIDLGPYLAGEPGALERTVYIFARRGMDWRQLDDDCIHGAARTLIVGRGAWRWGHREPRRAAAAAKGH
jgi:hypothetical protein